MTYGYCVYHEKECDYKGGCIDCPNNTEEDTEWFNQDDEQAESEEISCTNMKMWEEIFKAESEDNNVEIK